MVLESSTSSKRLVFRLIVLTVEIKKHCSILRREHFDTRLCLDGVHGHMVHSASKIKAPSDSRDFTSSCVNFY